MSGSPVMALCGQGAGLPRMKGSPMLALCGQEAYVGQSRAGPLWSRSGAATYEGQPRAGPLWSRSGAATYERQPRAHATLVPGVVCAEEVEQRELFALDPRLEERPRRPAVDDRTEGVSDHHLARETRTDRIINTVKVAPTTRMCSPSQNRLTSPQ